MGDEVGWLHRVGMRSIKANVTEESISTHCVNAADEELIRRIVGGAREDFAVLVERYQSLIFSMIMRQGGARDIADELAQETFIRAFANISTFRGKAKFSSWLIRIALNQTSNFFASKKFKESRQTVSLDLESHDRAAETSAEPRYSEAFLSAVIGELPPKFREVVVLCGYEGRSYEETAAILEIPIGTVRSRLNRARLMIKDEVGLRLGGRAV